MAGEARGPLAFGGLSVPRPRREAARAWGVSLVWGTRIPRYAVGVTRGRHTHRKSVSPQHEGKIGQQGKGSASSHTARRRGLSLARS
jgi:hypothetical protein